MDTADASVLRELEEAENEAKETAKIVNELKQRVGQLLKVSPCGSWRNNCYKLYM